MHRRGWNAVLAVAFASTLSTCQAWAEPRASLGATEHDFGAVRRGDAVQGTFPLRNEGDTPLEIAGARLSMPGMTIKLPSTIAAGAAGVVVVTWKTDRVQGALRGTATLDTNDPRARSVTLTLAGTVHGPVDIEPMAAVFLSSFVGEDVRRELTLRSNQSTPVTLRLEASDGAHYTAELLPVESGKSWRLRVHVAPGTPHGRYEETVTLVSDDAAIGTLRLAVHLFVKQELYANPDVLDFGEIPLSRLREQPGAVRFLDQLVILRKRQGALRLRGMRSDVASLDLRATAASGESASFRIDAGLRPERLEPGSIDGTIWIETDDAEFPRLAIRVRGRLVAH